MASEESSVACRADHGMEVTKNRGEEQAGRTTSLDGGSAESIQAGEVFFFNARETGHFQERGSLEQGRE